MVSILEVKKNMKNTIRQSKILKQALDAGVEIDENDLWQSMSNALEEDFGKIDTSTINWWDKILIRIKIWTGLL